MNFTNIDQIDTNFQQYSLESIKGTTNPNLNLINALESILDTNVKDQNLVNGSFLGGKIEHQTAFEDLFQKKLCSSSYNLFIRDSRFNSNQIHGYLSKRWLFSFFLVF